MLLDEWRKFKGFAVLEYFLWDGHRIHIKGLARKLKLSPRTAQIYLQMYEHEGILTSEKVGNLVLYGLSSSNYLTIELKRLYALFRMNAYIREFISSNKNLGSLILYGSVAKGEYDKKSDIDLLAVSQTRNIELKSMKDMEIALNREVKVEVLSAGELRRLADRKDNFYLSIAKNNIVLYGASL